MTRVTLPVLVLLLTACNGTVRINFETMIPEDLAIYNEGLPRDEQVVCQPAHSDWINGKYRHVPKWCKTVGYIKKLQNRRWDHPFSASGYSNSGGNYQPADAADYPSTFGGNND